MENLYTLEQLTESIINEYELMLPPMEDIEAYSEAKNKYQMRVYRALKNTGLLEKGIFDINPTTKRKCKFYTEQQRQIILSEKTLYDYVRSHSQSDKIKGSKTYKEMQQIIEARRSIFIQYLDRQKNDDNTAEFPHITNSEYTVYKNNLMLAAIFEELFTPINDELLMHDLERELFKDDLHLEVEDIESEYRLSHPEGSYYTRKKTQPD